MKFTIYGSGCAKCKQLAANAEQAAQALGLDFEVEKVTETSDIVDAGIMRTPALAIDGEVAVEGKVASAGELEKLLAR